MRVHLAKRACLRFLLAGLGGLAVAVLPARGQTASSCQPVPAPCPPALSVPGTLSPVPGMAAPGTGVAPPPVSAAPSDTGLAGAFAAPGASSPGDVGTFRAPDNGYIDGAMPLTQFRLRFDAAYDNNRPDRAEFFYPKCGCFQTRDAKGPPLVERSVDSQELSAYLEVALGNRVSGFFEVPVRFINPEVNRNATGVGDLNFGFKYAVVACQDQFLTFQFRTYVPTGDGFRGLGTEHVSLEPAVLWHKDLTERLRVDAELRDWIPVSGSEFAGNVLRYGVGVSYAVVDGPGLRVAPSAELVGWTALSGKELADGRKLDADGDSILNAKVGVRVGFGDGNGLLSGSDLYVGYGRALTGEVWYKDVVRIEYRMRF